MLNLNQKTPYDEIEKDELKEICLSCTKCDLAPTRTNVVFGHGPIQAN